MKTSLLVSALAILSTCAAQFDSNQCGPAAGNQKCKQNKCCSQYGWCGTGADYCQPTRGCQSAFGRCTGVTSSVAASPPASSSLSGPVGTSTDKCGPNANGLICAKNYCCSPHGYCGKTSAYCSTGCQSQFGSCSVSAPSSTSSKASTPSAPSAPISLDARCGTAHGGRTCEGSAYGNCCSSKGWCGTTKDHCKAGCQSAFGICPGASSSTISSASSSASSSSASNVASSSSSVASSASSSTSLEPSTTEMPPTPSAPVDRVLLPKRDPSVDRSSPTNLNPSSPLTLFYGETSPGTYTMLIKATLASGDKGILLENIAAVDGVICLPNSILIRFTDDASAQVARTWSSGTVLFTLFDGCNANDERGVYVMSNTPTVKVRAAGNIVEFSVSKSTLKDVVEELDISYGQLVSGADGNQMTSYTTTVTSYFTNSRAGTLTSSTFVSTITPSLTTMTYTSTTTSASDSSSLGAPSSTETWTLNPSAEAMLEELSAGLPPAGEDGTINIPIEKKNDAVVPVQPVGVAPYNEDPQYQAALQSALEADQLDPPETMVADAINLLGDDESNVPENSPVQLVVSDYAGTDDAVYDSAPPVELVSSSGTEKRHTPARAASAPAPRTAVDSRDLVSLQKRDGWDTFFEVMGDDLVGEICEACGLISAGKDIYDAFKCLFGSCPSPPQKTIDTLEGITKQEFKLSSSLTKGGKLFGDSKATVLCVDCRLEVSSLRVEGSVKIIAKQVNYPENFVMSAAFTATQSSVAALVFNLRVTQAGAGSFDRALSTWKMDSLTVPSVFTISPVFLWGMGLTYDTVQPIDVQAGAVLTLSNAAADLNIKDKTATNPRNWQPSAQVTYPTLAKAGRVALTPYVKTDVQLSLTIFGTYLENAAVLATQNNMGFDAQVLTTAESVKRAAGVQAVQSGVNAHEKRQGFNWWDITARMDAARAALAALNAAQPPKPQCNAGSMKLNAVMNTKNNAVVGGKAVNLFNENYKFGSQCIPFAAPVVSTTTTPTPTPSSTSTRISSTLSSSVLTSSSVVSSAAPSAPTCLATGFVPPAGSSCFKVVGHGVASIEGKYLHKTQGWASPEFEWFGPGASIFYLDSDGHMYESTAGDVMATDRTDGGFWVQFSGIQYVGSQPKAVCTKGPSSSLSCFQTTTSVISISGDFGEDDSRRVTPMFGMGGPGARGYQPITLTYENTACPALCNAQTSTRAPTSTVMSTPVPTPSSTAQCVPDLAFYSPSGLGCFTVTGHGPAHVEGKPMAMKAGYSGSVFGFDDYTPATFYIDPTANDGLMYVASGIANGWIMSMVSDVGADPWMGFWPDSQIKQLNYPKASCSLSTTNKDLQCTMAGFSTLKVAPTKDYYGTQARSGNPIFGVPANGWKPMTLTYTTVSCPRKCEPEAPTLPSSTTMPSPSADMTTQYPKSTTVSSTTVTSSATPSATPEVEAPCGGLAPGGLTKIGNKTYNVYCGKTGSSPLTKIDAVFLPSFTACITSCNTLTGCRAVMYREIAPVNGAYQCTRYSALGLPDEDGMDWTDSYDIAIAQFR